MFTINENRRLFCHHMPKVELHAHLNGSFSQNTLTKLMKMKNIEPEKLKNQLDIKSKTLEECFEMFKVLHSLCDSEEAILILTKDVVEEFAKENVIYLELRTTPKDIIEENSVSNTSLLSGNEDISIKATKFYKESFINNNDKIPLCSNETKEQINDLYSPMNNEKGSTNYKMTKYTYLRSVISGIRQAQKESDIDVKLLLSVDRSKSIEDAWETLKLAQEFNLSDKNGIVVGLDFSGNPEIKNIEKFIPILTAAKSSGLALSIHLAEVPNCKDEIKALLSLCPDRIGHATFLNEQSTLNELNQETTLQKQIDVEESYKSIKQSYNSVKNYQVDEKLYIDQKKDSGSLINLESVQFVLDKKIPIEICKSSNLQSGTVKELNQHHFKFWHLTNNHPCCICTDDKGIFSTTLSKEYELVSETFNLNAEQIWDLSIKSIDYIFQNQLIKNSFKNKFNENKKKLFDYYKF